MFIEKVEIHLFINLFSYALQFNYRESNHGYLAIIFLKAYLAFCF